MDDTFDAVIIGAGIIGCCTAFELSKMGYKTLNVDKLPAAGYGSTSNSCAIIRFHYSTPDGVAMAREGYFYWLDWPKYLETRDDRGMAVYRNTGALVVKTETNKFLKHVMPSLDALGIGYVQVDPTDIDKYVPNADTRSYFPCRTMDDPAFGQPGPGSIKGAIWIPESGYVSDPQLSTHNVQVAAEAKGAVFRFNAEVVDILKQGGRVAGVEIKDLGAVHAPVVLNAAGPHSPIINAMAGVLEGMNIRTRPLKQEVCHVPAPEGVDWERDGFLLSDGDIGCYSRPEVGNHILIGSEDPPCDQLEWVDDPDDYNKNFSRQWTTQVLREAQRMPGLPVPNQPQGIVDLYDVTDDWLPIYDKSDLPGFYLAIGTSGNQYKNAPVVGKLMAELIHACENGRDHDSDPFPFYMAYTKRTCNVGFFSRRRKINPDSSFSVIG